MSKKAEENLSELLGQFYGEPEAGEVLEDIKVGDAILGENSAPVPSDELVLAIKSKTAEKLEQKKTVPLRSIIYHVSTIAAAILIVVGIGIMRIDKAEIETAGIVSASLWENLSSAEENDELVTLAAEIEEIESELVALQLNETNGNGQNGVIELEMEYIEIESDFWKG